MQTQAKDPNIAEAEANGISRNTYRKRIALGWSVEEAKTRFVGQVKRQSPHTSRDIAIAEQNGISYKTFHARIANGWTINEAKTKKPDYGNAPRERRHRPKPNSRTRSFFSWTPADACPSCESNEVRFGGSFNHKRAGYFCGDCLAEWDHYARNNLAAFVRWDDY